MTFFEPYISDYIYTKKECMLVSSIAAAANDTKREQALPGSVTVAIRAFLLVDLVLEATAGCGR